MKWNSPLKLKLYKKWHGERDRRRRRRWCSEAIFENKRIGRLFMNPGSLVKTNMRLGAMPNTCEMDIRVVVVSFYSFLGSIT